METKNKIKQNKMKEEFTTLKEGEEFVTPREWLSMCGYTEEEVKKYYYMKELEEQILYQGQEKVILGINEDEEESNREKIKKILEKRKLLKDKLGE